MTPSPELIAAIRAELVRLDTDPNVKSVKADAGPWAEAIAGRVCAVMPVPKTTRKRKQ